MAAGLCKNPVSPMHFSRFSLPAVLAACAMALAGCASGRGPRFAVDDSQLNWMEISYRPGSPAAKPCHISLLGTGSLSYRSGNSPQLSNSFSTDVTHPSWGDISEGSFPIPPSEMRQIFQSFLDHGALDNPKSDKNAGKTPGQPVVSLTSKFRNAKPSRRITSDPVLVGMVERLIRWIELEESR